MPEAPPVITAVCPALKMAAILDFLINPEREEVVQGVFELSKMRGICDVDGKIPCFGVLDTAKS